MKITFIGGGNMASALIGGMLRNGFAAAGITVVEPGSSARERLQAMYDDIVCVNSVADLACIGDLLLLAVKPQQMREACAPLNGKLGSALVISIAAGLDLATLSRFLGGHRRIVRCMPNTPALIGASMTGLCALPEVDLASRAVADQALAAVGDTLWVDEERQMDGVTALSGSGPAYVFLLIEALQQAAAELGFTPEQGRQLAIETVAGAAAQAARSTESAATLRARVTSKGGTTEAALRVMLDAGVKEGVIAGVKAAAVRSRELGEQLGSNA
ncbi:MAG: pyrroline-5-carboxylate reductase [Azonexus sp.]|jgi:pyrroline-5-carboxylate reductase|nr:pyrroline-5-carboxylate reductase [Azonexus sp.]